MSSVITQQGATSLMPDPATFAFMASSSARVGTSPAKVVLADCTFESTNGPLTGAVVSRLNMASLMASDTAAGISALMTFSTTPSLSYSSSRVTGIAMPRRLPVISSFLKSILLSVSLAASSAHAAVAFPWLGQRNLPTQPDLMVIPTLSQIRPARRGFSISCCCTGMIPVSASAAVVCISRTRMMRASLRFFISSRSCVSAFCTGSSFMACAACSFICSTWFSRRKVSNSAFSASLRSRCSCSHTSAISSMRAQFCWYFSTS